jgi:NADH:ubiquinone oxidoreductase subunit H
MTTPNRAWGNLTLLGKVMVPLLFLLFVVGPILTFLLVTVVGPWLMDVFNSNLGIVRFVVAITGILLFSIPAAFIIIYMELKVIAFMNLRVGPNRIGPGGALMSVVHGLKVLSREDFTPTGADRIVFTWAPVLVFLTAVMTFLVIPFGPGLVGQDLNIGLLYLFAVGGMSVVGLLLAGWSSFNKYSLLGGLRAAAQVVSYEIPLTLSVVGLILLAGTMSMNTIAEAQARQTGRHSTWPRRTARSWPASPPSTRGCASGSCSSPST